jgi:hypothetical protein
MYMYGHSKVWVYTSIFYKMNVLECYSSFFSHNKIVKIKGSDMVAHPVILVTQETEMGKMVV